MVRDKCMKAFPIFDDEEELEIDEVLVSIAWGLCGRDNRNKIKPLTKNHRKVAAF